MSITTNSKIEIIVQSKYPEVLKEFKRTFGVDVLLHEITGSEYGAKIINKIILEARGRDCEVIGIFNDDLWFSDGWLETTLPYLNDHIIVSPGYIETNNWDKFQEVVEKTKNETGFVNYLYGANALYRMDIFKAIGMFDEQFGWSCDDLDWALRVKLNGLSSITLKRITTAHTVGATRTKGVKDWNTLSTANKQKFYLKHGYFPYRHLRREYLDNHQYFRQFSYYE